MREVDEAYFARIEAELDEAFEVAERARERGQDPVPDVEIPVAQDMADRVENILGIDGVAERVRELEADYSREEAALELARDFAEGRVGDYDSDAGKIEGAVRTAVALLTEGVVAAPIEGIDRVELVDGDAGGQFVSVYYAGPIRSAGGTAQALSVLVADYTRALLDVGEYRARDDEIERYAEEVALYDSETGLQYTPKQAESTFIAEHCPIMLDGEATGDGEVQGYRDLERVDTNSPRGGMCLVLAEGIALKAPKIQRYTDQLDAIDWPWLQDLIDGTIGKGDGDGDESGATPDDGELAASERQDDGTNGEEDEGEDADDADDAAPDGPPRVEPSGKYLRDLIAGRPVLGHPSQPGGFRLRYGRSRNHGFATAGVHPATMHLVDDFLATGTQIKTERPGKAAGVIPVDSIEGPTVRLANGEVRRIDDPEEARAVRNGVEAILDLGEYLVNYGEFVENNHPLAPASYVQEWWEQELVAAGANVQALADSPYVDLADPTAAQALAWATDHDAPLHPEYTYLYHDLGVADLDRLADAIAAGTVAPPGGDGAAAEDAATTDGGTLTAEGTDGPSRVDPADPRELLLANDDAVRETLEALLVEHAQDDDRIRVPDWVPLARTVGVTTDLEREWALADLSPAAREADDAMRAVNEIAPFTVRERAPTRVGCRMGRPEKSESRELSPAVHTLFPIGEAGGDQRDVSAASTHAAELNDVQGRISVQLGVRRCTGCGAETFWPKCRDCGSRTERHFECEDCEVVCEPDESGRVACPRCEREVSSTRWWELDLRDVYRDALASVGERENAFEILKGVKGLTSASKVPEPLEKGVLRAKHGVSSFKDGTVRYDMTDLPLTAVRPAEVDVSADALRALGYEEDVHGEPLVHDDQLVHLKVQDVILSDGAAEHMLNTADFVDDLLESYYGVEPYYEVDDREELVGELVFGLAPHTSAAVVGRVVGFTSAAVGYAHPYFHAAKRRNCDGDEDCVMLLMDGLLNFSREFLPERRGGTMDAPLVMSSRIDPTEIDDEAHNVDIVERYPREFYEATREMADPDEVDITIAEETLGTDREYAGFGHTHDTSGIALGPDLSAYKTLAEMERKMDAQLELARKLRCTDETDVAERIIEYHFLPDLIGNLRAFASQEVRCLDCGEKYRRPPLTRDCRECGGDVTLTVHEGSVAKYMDTSLRVAREYGAREYTNQRLDILDRTLESLFENDKNRPSSLGDFM